jgi:hypothetical protein
MTTPLRTALQGNHALTILAGVMSGLLLITVVGLLTDDRTIGGQPIWLKPAKFAISFVFYGLTLAWLLAHLRRGKRIAWWAANVVVVTACLEVGIIVTQTIRGRASHFNQATALDELLWRPVRYTYPVAAYDHDPAPGWNCTSDVGVAVAGGFVYRGHDLPKLYGKYVFGDLVDGRILYTEANEMRRGQGLAPVHRLALFDTAGNPVRMQDLSGPGAPGDPNRVDLRFGTDAQGELYIVAKANATIWKVTGTRVFANGDVGDTRVRHTAGAENWAPVTPSKWQFTHDQVILAEAGVSRPGPRRPFEYAVLTAGPVWSSVEVEAEVRLDTPVEVTNRDVIIVFGWRSDTEFYYAHLSTDNTIYPHNGIFKVNNGDRERIEYQWNGRSRGANPAITDADWHKVRVVHLPATGERGPRREACVIPGSAAAP